jgi:hypothetical protein
MRKPVELAGRRRQKDVGTSRSQGWLAAIFQPSGAPLASLSTEFGLGHRMQSWVTPDEKCYMHNYRASIQVFQITKQASILCQMPINKIEYLIKR